MVTTGSISMRERRASPDVTRAIAMFGVVLMNYHGAINDVRDPNGFWEHLFHPYTGVLSTRFAVTFVLMAGVGVALMAANSDPLHDRHHSTLRVRLARRGLLLYAAGLALNHAWGGTIIFYYGAYLLIAALIVRLSSRILLIIAGVAMTASAVLRGWLDSRPVDAPSIEWLNPRHVHTVADLLGRTFTGYTHPVLPWIAFFIAGILIGRRLDRFEANSGRIALGTAAVTALLYVAVDLLSGLMNNERSWFGGLLSMQPFDRGFGYSLSTLAIAVTAFASITTVVRAFPRNRVVGILRSPGQTTLSLYLGHILVYYILFRWWTVIVPHGLHSAIIVSSIYWIAGIAVTTMWHRRFGMGPAERLYRAIGG